MATKPTYEELEQRIRELETDCAEPAPIADDFKIPEKIYRSMIEQTNDFVALTTFSLNPVYLYLSPSNTALGYDPKELVGKSVFKFIHPGDIKKMIPLLKKYIALRKERILARKEVDFTEKVEYRFKTKSGDWCHLQTTGNLIDDKILFISRDVTGQRKIEDELKRSNDVYKTLVEKAPIGIFYSSLSGKFIYGNKRAEEIIGYKTSELKGKSFLKLKILDPKDMITAAKLLALSNIGKATGPEAFTLNRKGGSRAIVEINTETVTIGGKKVVLGMMQDMTETIQANNKLGQIEHRYRTLIFEMLNGFALHEIICDKAGKPCNYRFLDVNPAFEKVTGLKAADIVGKTALDVLPGLEPVWIEKYGNVALTGNPERFQQFARPLNKYFEVLVYRPKTGRFATVFTDVTRRKHAEQALKESEEKYRSMMEAMKDGAYICSSKYRINYMNPAMVKRVGRDATGEPCHKAIFNSEKKCAWCVFDQVLKGQSVEFEVAEPVSGNCYSTSHSPLHNPDGSISKLTISRDITHIRKMEKQLFQAGKMEAISTLSGGIAHQFNNALYVITGNIDLLEMGFPGNDKIADYAGAMKVSAHKMAQLTAQLLAYARGGKYQTKTISFGDFVKETMPLVKHSIDAAIQMELDMDLPCGVNVTVDSTQMQMVLSAVLANASEAMEGKGLIRIAGKTQCITDDNTEAFPDLKPGNYVSLSITDEGKGMDEEVGKRIFEPFFTTKFEGRGLGMAAAYGIVRNHDGWISVDSEPDKGTIVKIYLPAVKTLVKEDVKPKPKTQWIKGKGTVLVIDDEKDVRQVSRVMLEWLGYHVLEAETGKKAIDIVNTFEGDIDLAMLDILLPDMEGNAIYPFLKKARPDLKVMVFSGYSIDGPAREILNAGAEGFIQKPFAMVDLSEKLKIITKMN